MAEKTLTIENMKDVLVKGVVISVDKTECNRCVITQQQDKGVFFIHKDNRLGFLAWWWLENNLDNIHIIGSDKNSDITENTILPKNYDME